MAPSEYHAPTNITCLRNYRVTMPAVIQLFHSVLCGAEGPNFLPGPIHLFLYRAFIPRFTWSFPFFYCHVLTRPLNEIYARYRQPTVASHSFLRSSIYIIHGVRASFRILGKCISCRPDQSRTHSTANRTRGKYGTSSHHPQGDSRFLEGQINPSDAIRFTVSRSPLSHDRSNRPDHGVLSQSGLSL